LAEPKGLPAMRLAHAVSHEGIYSGSWEPGLRHSKDVDFSRVCCLFGGQGTAVPGMFLSAYQQIERFRRRFDEADALARAAGLPAPSLYLTDGRAIPASELFVTRNLAAYTTQVALFDHILASGSSPQLLTGSSQGEYAALVCSGAVDFASLFDVNIAWQRICGPANQLGFLLAVAASPAQIAALLGNDRVHVSILNCPMRSVIALAPEQLAEVQDTLRRRGIGAKVLEVPQPYHSPMMQPAAERLRAWLKEHGPCFRPPRIPVLSSVSRSVISEGLSSSEAAELLSRQLIEPVDFPRQIEMSYESGCFAFLEIGPGATLGTFVRKTLGAREHRILDFGAYLPVAPTRERPKTKLDALQSKVFGTLRKAVAVMTGYEIESISVEDRFQEDLAIDSLTKVEILVHVVREIDPGREDLGDLVGVHRLADVVQVFSGSPNQERLS
jgi:acyl transferase domain-containing protein